jgi:aconitate hydratase 2/2-methylisocitrate dehydratase
MLGPGASAGGAQARTDAPRLWIAPPTSVAEAQLRAEGHYATFADAGARTEVPGCSLCMGNQARVAAGATVVSTSTRNYPGRMGDGANVYLASAEVAAVAARLGALPTPEQYRRALAPGPAGHA